MNRRSALKLFGLASLAGFFKGQTPKVKVPTPKPVVLGDLKALTLTTVDRRKSGTVINVKRHFYEEIENEHGEVVAVIYRDLESHNELIQ